MQEGSDNTSLRNHLANERTFLAWIRTCIGIMAFGFVVEKFSLFIRQIAVLLGTSHLLNTTTLSPKFQGYSSFAGIVLVILGSILCLMAFIKYKKIEAQINNNTFHPTILLDLMLTLTVVLVGLFLGVYLLNSI